MLFVKKCPFCGKIYNKNDNYYCLSCNHRLEIYSEQDIKKDQIERLQNKERIKINNMPKCPTCGSTNIKKISASSKVFGAAMFGLFSKTARSQFECQNCHYKW